MSRIVGGLFVLVLAVSLLLLPAPVSAQDGDGYGGIGAACEWDPVKWEDNENSWNLYIKNWGRTPIQAMSRLAGLCGPDVICDEAFGVKCPIARNTCWAGACASCHGIEAGCLAACDDPVACEAPKSGDACEATAQAQPECPTEVMVRDAHCCCCWG